MLHGLARGHGDLASAEPVSGRQGLCSEGGHDGRHAARSSIGGRAVGSDVEDTSIATGRAGDHDIAVLHGLAGIDGDLASAEPVSGRQGLCSEGGHDGGHAALSGIGGGAVSGDVEDAGLTTGRAGEDDIAVFLRLPGCDGDFASGKSVTRRQCQG